ncbi:MAG: metal-dependent transcriptional regulator [Methanospirillum sp.]|nr:metal-dependent transcriptional regulator [Methanospirillum sp.]
MTEESRDHEEDLLEALLEEPRPDDAALAARLGLDADAFERLLQRAVTNGRLEPGPGGRYGLNHEGRRVARRIARRHRTLACFFEQIGMEREAADREACTLEHGVSDEAIARIAGHLRCPRPFERPCTVPAGEGQPLLDFLEGERVRITYVRPCGRFRRLMDMGVVPGEEVVVRRRLSNRAVVIEVKGCEIGLSPECAETVLASPCR